MFDNVAFNVVIGLVFIYLLYSLLATILAEIAATTLSIRSRILRESIERMLNDGFRREVGQSWHWIKKPWWGFVDFFFGRFWIIRSKYFKHSFAAAFYNSPAIKYLGRLDGANRGLFGKTKPSYLSADYFADTLIQLLKNKGMGNTDAQKISFCLKFNTYKVESASIKHLRDLWNHSGEDKTYFKDNLMKWYNETQDRATGWYKTTFRVILFVIGLLIALIFNLDSLQLGRILSKDKQARNELVILGISLSKDSSRYRGVLNKDSTLPDQVLDSGLARVSQDIQSANYILGLGWHLDTFQKREALIGPLKRVQDSVYITRWATALPKMRFFLDSIHQDLIRNQLRVNALTGQLMLAALDTLRSNRLKAAPNHPDPKILQLTDSLSNTQVDIKKDSILERIGTVQIKRYTDSLNQYVGLHFIEIDSLSLLSKGDSCYVSGSRKLSIEEKLQKFFVIAPQSQRWVGFLLTALALSLGAPFWFGVLNKLISLRGTGVKPEEKKPPSTVNPVLNNAPPLVPNNIAQQVVIPRDNIQKALLLYGQQLYTYPGVKALMRVQLPAGNAVLQINVADQPTQNQIERDFPNNILTVDGMQVPYRIVFSGTPRNNMAFNLQVGQIYNASTQNGAGSLGCILKEDDSGILHLLSCWHVLKGDLNYDQSDLDTLINDDKAALLGIRWGGGIEGCLDYGLAQLAKTANTKNNATLFAQLGLQGRVIARPLNGNEIDGHLDIQYFDALSQTVQRGVIYSDIPSIKVHYQDSKVRELNDILILTKSFDQPKAICQHGNSGALVFDRPSGGNTAAAIGMLIASDDLFSYAIKLSNFFSLHTKMSIVNAK